jgi:soluble lytic murein transglycosylase
MRIRLALSLLFLIHTSAYTNPVEYLQRFNAFNVWSTHLPLTPDAQFLAFINSNTPWAHKLRERWLYQLASRKDWRNFALYYQPTQDKTLQCFYHRAEYSLGHKSVALQAAASLWLSEASSPVACNPLFAVLLQSDNFDETLITRRITLALAHNNVALSRYLLRQYKKPRVNEIAVLNAIYQTPQKISQLTPGALHGDFYLYGLKRLFGINMTKAIAQWHSQRTRKLLSLEQQQLFIAHVALMKAVREDKDADAWFKQLTPRFYSELLLDWKIRLALKHLRWREVIALIKLLPDKDNPCWHYWLARAWEANGDLPKAHETYARLAKTRHYYGFLASLRLHQQGSFQKEATPKTHPNLAVYHPFTATIQQLHTSKHFAEASRLLNDFVLEMPKIEKCALIAWVANTLHWHDKSLVLSNTDELANQLELRFPRPFEHAVLAYARQYHVAPALIYAIIRQESGFREDVISSAGAAGLMQVMPTTASLVAAHNKIAYRKPIQLYSPQNNIHIGVAYLRHLADRFSHNMILMAAAYNAGPSQANYWLKHHSPKEMDIWIETLPWHETRNYLKNIISFYEVYQYEMHEKSELRRVMRML